MSLVPLPTRLLFAVDDTLQFVGDKIGLWSLMGVGEWLVSGPIGRWIMRRAVNGIPGGTTVADFDFGTGKITYIVGGHGWPVTTYWNVPRPTP